MSVTYKVVFSGLAQGISASDASAALRDRFKLTQDQAHKLVSNKGQTVKKGLDLQTAAKFEAAFTALGCNVSVLPETEEPLVLDVSDAPEAQEREPRQQRQPEAEHNHFGGWLQQTVGFVFSLLLVAYGVYIMEPAWLMKIVRTARGPSELEKVMRIGVSTQSDFAQFKSKGGLELDSRWKGFRVVHLEVVHGGPQGELTALFIKVHRNFPGYDLASLDNFKKALQGECGTKWDVNQDQGAMEGTSPTGVQCVINGYGGPSEPVDVMIATKAKPDATAAAKKAPSVATEPQPKQAGLLPASGSYALATESATSRLQLTVSGMEAKFSLASEVRGGEHQCSLSGVARVEDAALKYGPDADQCSVTMLNIEGQVEVETSKCNNSCGMKAAGTLDGSYSLVK